MRVRCALVFAVFADGCISLTIFKCSNPVPCQDLVHVMFLLALPLQASTPPAQAFDPIHTLQGMMAAMNDQTA